MTMMQGMMGGPRTSQDDASRGFEIYVAAVNNTAMVQLKLLMYDGCIRSASEVLAADPANCKALYRRGAAQAAKGLVDEAKVDLRKALELEPANEAIVAQLGIVAAKEAEAHEKMRAAYSKMFA